LESDRLIYGFADFAAADVRDDFELPPSPSEASCHVIGWSVRIGLVVSALAVVNARPLVWMVP